MVDESNIKDKKSEPLTSKVKRASSMINGPLIFLAGLGLITYIIIKPDINAYNLMRPIRQEEKDLKQTYMHSLNICGDIDKDGKLSGEERLNFNLELLKYLKGNGITVKRRGFGERFREVFTFVYADKYCFPTDNMVPRSKLIDVINNYMYDLILEFKYEGSLSDYKSHLEKIDIPVFSKEIKSLLEKDLF